MFLQIRLISGIFDGTRVLARIQSPQMIRWMLMVATGPSMKSNVLKLSRVLAVRRPDRNDDTISLQIFPHC